MDLHALIIICLSRSLWGRVSGEETTGWVSGRQQLRLVCGHLTSAPWLNKKGVPQASCHPRGIMSVLRLALVDAWPQVTCWTTAMGWKRVEGWNRGTIVVVDNIIGCRGNCIGIYKLRQYCCHQLVSMVTTHPSCSAPCLESV